MAVPVSTGFDDPRISGEISREVERIARMLPPDASCLVTGSIMEGLGNKNSDIDVYVVHNAAAGSNPIALGLRASRYVDCEYMTLTSLDQLATRIRQLDWASVAELPFPWLDRFYRVAIAVPVTLAPDAAQVLERFDKPSACEAFSAWSLLAGCQLLARGAVLLASGDRHEADLLLRQSALWRANSVLATQGEGYVSNKWTAEKAARLYGRDDERYRDLVDDYLRPPGTTADLLTRLRRKLIPPVELSRFLAERRLELADGVRHVALSGTDRLVRGRAAIAEVSGALALVCRGLAAGAMWDEATADAAEQLSVPTAELRTAAWHYSAELRRGGFLLAVPEGS